MGFDFKKNIDEVREIYKNKSPKLKDNLLMPNWLRGDDPLTQIYIDQKTLYKNGKIFYGCLVQANNMLFERYVPSILNRYTNTSLANPAAIVFSPDPYFDDMTDELAKIGRFLFKYKGTENVPSDWKTIIDSITGEKERLFNVRLPNSITNGKEVYYTSIMVIRKHIPKKRLMGNIFPIVAEPNSLKTSIILPKHYWTKQLKQLFCGKLR